MITVNGQIVGLSKKAVKGSGFDFIEYSYYVGDNQGAPVKVLSTNKNERKVGEKVNLHVWVKKWQSKKGVVGFDIVEVKQNGEG